jgi:hypothetical protein
MKAEKSLMLSELFTKIREKQRSIKIVSINEQI